MKQQNFIDTIFPSVLSGAVTALVLAVVATWLHRQHHVRLPGMQPMLTPVEQVNEGLGALNAAELQAGRQPFTITRVVAAQLAR